ncbi:MAG TPA: CoA transferase [Mycobacteriales bacterium]|nr:CoA transferase [Mycobacteriales bacterium]
MATGLLHGVRVLDLGIWRPVPYATQLLVELGAEVIKVEPPGGDPMRMYPGLFAILNAGKRSFTVDLKDADQRAAVLDLARDADVVAEGFRPGVAAKLGVGPDDVRTVNPAAVYCSISGFGQTGPARDVSGHDLSYQARAGLLEPKPGGEPIVARPPVADIAAGAYAAMAVCAALVRAGRTGEGEVIDVAMTDVLATWTGPASALESGEHVGGVMPGYGTFQTSDGWIVLSVINEDHFWRALMDGLGHPELAALTMAERYPRGRELQKVIADAVRDRGRDELVATLGAAGVPVAAVLGQREMAADEQLVARGLFRTKPDGMQVMRHPVKLAEHPALDLDDVPPLSPDRPSWSPR